MEACYNKTQTTYYFTVLSETLTLRYSVIVESFFPFNYQGGFWNLTYDLRPLNFKPTPYLSSLHFLLLGASLHDQSNTIVRHIVLIPCKLLLQLYFPTCNSILPSFTIHPPRHPHLTLLMYFNVQYPDSYCMAVPFETPQYSFVTQHPYNAFIFHPVCSNLHIIPHFNV